MTEAMRLERGLGFMGELEILPLVCQLSPRFVEHLTFESLLANRNRLLEILRGLPGSNVKAVAEAAGKMAPLPGDLYALAVARKTWSGVSGQVYLDRPNVLSLHREPRLSLEGRPLIRESFDIVENYVAVDNGPGANPFRARLHQGVVDTNAEALLAASRFAGEPSRSCCRDLDNTAEFFARRTAANSWFAVRSPQEARWQSVGLPADMRVRVEDELARGAAVIVPDGGLTVDSRPAAPWWTVDHVSGQTLGIGDRGWGQSEYTAMQRVGFGVLSAAVCGAFATADVKSTPTVGEVLVCALTGVAGGLGATAAGAAAVGLITGLAVGIWLNDWFMHLALPGM